MATMGITTRSSPVRIKQVLLFIDYSVISNFETYILLNLIKQSNIIWIIQYMYQIFYENC
jgi:hypothetical protein